MCFYIANNFYEEAFTFLKSDGELKQYLISKNIPLLDLNYLLTRLA
jgi:hypothetical protein